MHLDGILFVFPHWDDSFRHANRNPLSAHRKRGGLKTHRPLRGLINQTPPDKHIMLMSRPELSGDYFGKLRRKGGVVLATSISAPSDFPRSEPRNHCATPETEETLITRKYLCQTDRWVMAVLCFPSHLHISEMFLKAACFEFRPNFHRKKNRPRFLPVDYSSDRFIYPVPLQRHFWESLVDKSLVAPK